MAKIDVKNNLSLAFLLICFNKTFVNLEVELRRTYLVAGLATFLGALLPFLDVHYTKLRYTGPHIVILSSSEYSTY